MSQSREIKRRIRSIQNTKKITKAMEMVAAAKMRKAVQQVLVSREYSSRAWQIVQNIASSEVKHRHPLLQKNIHVNRVAVLLISSNRGLCGGFNSNIVKEAHRTCQKLSDQKIQFDFITFGKKGADQIRKFGYNIVADFSKPDLLQNITTITPISHILLDGYIKNHYQQTILIYTDFQSSLRQIPISKILLPLSTTEDQNIGQIGDKNEKIESKNNIFYEYKFEPSPAQVLDQILPRIFELQIYQSCLESDASEHSSRMISMKNAYSAATDMIDELTLAYNQARQAAITQEIAEIVAGANSLA